MVGTRTIGDFAALRKRLVVEMEPKTFKEKNEREGSCDKRWKAFRQG
jgi:hypothetical protein